MIFKLAQKGGFIKRYDQQRAQQEEAHVKCFDFDKSSALQLPIIDRSRWMEKVFCWGENKLIMKFSFF